MRFHGETSRRFFSALSDSSSADGPYPLDDCLPADDRRQSGDVRAAGPWIPSRWARRLSIGLASILAAGAIGCATREDTPTMAPDSTLVYASRMPLDVNARITFNLRDSKKRAEERRKARELARQLAREKKEREKQERLRLERERKEKERLEREKAKHAKGKKGKKGSTSKKSKSETELPQAAGGRADRPGSGPSGGPGTASDGGTSDSATAETGGAADSAAGSPVDSGRVSTAAPRPADRGERSFDLEEGARVQATITLENATARGNRPLLFHMVWLNPAKKRVFKKMVEWTPSDSSSTLTGSFTISPAKRTPGFYSLQVFLFRELIAEKSFELRGTSTAVDEKDQEGGM
jgi:hypothetical protein